MARISVSELWRQLIDVATPLSPESRPLDEAAGLVLAEACVAAWDLPMADNSAMDGIAVRAADTSAATSDAPLRLPLAGTAYTGEMPGPLAPGTAVQIGTGGLLPAGADAVVPTERLQWGVGEIWLRSPALEGDHIRRRGEELRAGDVVVEAGRALTPRVLAALRAAGVRRVDIRRRPRVSIIPTGNELVPPGRTPRPGQVVETNASFLADVLRAEAGIEAQVLPVVPDTLEDLQAVLASQLESCDLIITTGGASVGARDYLRRAAAALGVDVRVEGVAHKPGKPLFVGRRRGAVLVGLPGNPGAVSVAWTVVIRPLLARLQGAFRVLPRQMQIPLAEAVRPDPHLLLWRWAVLEGDPPRARPLSRVGSGMLSAPAAAELLLSLPPGSCQLPEGSLVSAILLDGC